MTYKLLAAILVFATHCSICSPSMAQAGHGTDYSDVMHWVAKAPGIDNANGVKVQGHHAYVTNREHGIKVVDISDPAAPILAATFQTPGHAWAIDVIGDRAYIAVRYHGLMILDITEPSSPTLLGSYDTIPNIMDIKIQGSLAYVVDGDPSDGSFLHVLDVADPFAPIRLGKVTLPSVANNIAVADGMAYVSAWNAGLQVVDVSIPTAPVIVGAYEALNRTLGVTVDGDVAYVTSYYQYLQLLSIEDPTNPSLLGTVSLPDESLGVTIVDDLALVACYWHGLQIVDVSSVDEPALVGEVRMDGNAYDVDVSGSHVYVATEGTGLHVLEIGRGKTDLHLGGVDLYGSPKAMLIGAGGSHAFAAWGSRGLRVLDVSDPMHSFLVSTHDTPGSCVDLTIDDDLIYLADWSAGIQVVDISRPESPAQLANLDGLGNIIAIAQTANLSDSYILAAAVPDYGGSNLYVCDVGEPTAPALVTTINLPCVATEILVSGPLALVSGYSATSNSGRIILVDIADPTAPFIANQIITARRVDSMLMTGSWLFANDRDQGLLVYDMSEKLSPVLAGQHYLPSAVNGFALDDNHLYVASTGKLVFDVSEPTSPSIIGATSCIAADLALHAGYLLTIEGLGLRILPRHVPTITTAPSLPSSSMVSLGQNVPNPFNPRTTIDFELPIATATRLQVFDLRGRLVRTLLDQDLESGWHQTSWNGCDEAGRSMGTGIYVYRLQAGSFVGTGRMTLLK